MTKVTHTIFRTTIIVPERERALVFVDGVFERLLGPGKTHLPYRWNAGSRVRVQSVAVAKGAVLQDTLVDLFRDHSERLTDEFQEFITDRDEMAIVYRDGMASFLMTPETRKIVFRSAGVWTVERVNLSENLLIAPALANRLKRLTTNHIDWLSVGQGQIGLLHVDGALVKTLQPGGHAVWSYGRVLKLKLVDMRESAIDVTGQELLTKDRVSIRVNLAASYRVTDPVKAVEASPDFVDAIYRALGAAFRRSLTDKTLDDVLAKKGVIDAEAEADVARAFSGMGIDVRSVMVKDIILPGDMRDILNTVVIAEKEAEANIIRRREATAETRALLNTAKVMADNPAMMRLKELEALESIAEKVGTLTIHSGTKGLMEDLVSLKG